MKCGLPENECAEVLRAPAWILLQRKIQNWTLRCYLRVFPFRSETSVDSTFPGDPWSAFAYSRSLPVNCFSARRYNSEVFRMTSAGSSGAGGCLLNLIDNR